MRRLNILMVGDALFEDKPGGSRKYLSEVSRRLASDGHQVSVLVQKHNPTSPVYEVREGVHIYRFDYNRNNLLVSLITRFLSSRRMFEKLAKEITFDLINVHFALGGFGVLHSKRSLLIPCLFTFHGPWSHEVLTENIKRLKGRRGLTKFFSLGLAKLFFWVMFFMERYVIRRTNKFLVLSQFSKDLLTNIYSVSEEKIVVIPGGVDTAKFYLPKDKHVAKTKLGVPSHLPMLLTVRRLVSRMGLENLIQAMRIVIKKRRMLLIIGGVGHLENQLKSMVARCALEKYVRFVGYIPDEELSLYYQAADLFVLPSVSYEGFGLVTLEALSSGVPVLGTAVGGTIEILEELDSCLLISESEPKLLAQGIISTLERTDLSSYHFRQFIENNYSWEKILPKVEEFLVEVARQAVN